METDTHQLNIEGKNRQTESYNTHDAETHYTHPGRVADMKYT